MDIECLQRELNTTVLMLKKKTESRRANETNDHEEETIEYSSAIPEPESEEL
ncbi:hypothetical protein RO3G_07026 [Rhizopus delemar RA 99-880]|uniref:Uncharacterized protein n=1 Tax=Rhizopus delemar (strain RA 99-880 / ATCC MYA-4621 / FGSC 9543 / NRRL 43880) TaxID=246409 RepID=I1C1J1_RHIO9|nr:hypothetical protein RO3G_07026 [Rhizopus delemar RA 99-880]|eukprot:EIE82321.1 hypothetical protein RO3G_07026 [Rhizopus delemar RA 99-880]